MVPIFTIIISKVWLYFWKKDFCDNGKAGYLGYFVAAILGACCSLTWPILAVISLFPFVIMLVDTNFVIKIDTVKRPKKESKEEQFAKRINDLEMQINNLQNKDRYKNQYTAGGFIPNIKF